MGFVLDNRKERQEHDLRKSNLYSKRFFEEPHKFTFDVCQKKCESVKIKSKNANVSQFDLNDPIRVYSSLIEYGEKAAVRQYQTLLNKNINTIKIKFMQNLK